MIPANLETSLPIIQTMLSECIDNAKNRSLRGRTQKLDTERFASLAIEPSDIPGCKRILSCAEQLNAEVSKLTNLATAAHLLQQMINQEHPLFFSPDTRDCVFIQALSGKAEKYLAPVLNDVFNENKPLRFTYYPRNDLRQERHQAHNAAQTEKKQQKLTFQ